MSLGCWAAVAVGFLGVVVALRPDGDLLHLGSLTALGNAVLYALGAVMVRALSRSESSTTIVRSEEHTSELQSLMRISYAVFCLKKKTQKQRDTSTRESKKTYT